MNRHEWTKQSPGYDTVKRVRERGFFFVCTRGKCGQIWRWRRGCEETDVKPFVVCNKERKWAFFSEYVINVVRCVFIHSTHNSIILMVRLSFAYVSLDYLKMAFRFYLFLFFSLALTISRFHRFSLYFYRSNEKSWFFVAISWFPRITLWVLTSSKWLILANLNIFTTDAQKSSTNKCQYDEIAFFCC